MARPSTRFPARPRPIADLIEPCLGPALAAQGFAAADIIVAWPEIVGQRLAAWCQPIKIDWPKRPGRPDPEARREPAALVVRVESAFALELQHLAPLIVERVNAHYGWRCVGRLVLKQGPVRRPAPRRATLRPLAEPERARIEERVRAVEDEPLRTALDRLGQAVLGSGPAADRTKP